MGTADRLRLAVRLALTVSVLVVTACGTTVPHVDRQASQPGLGLMPSGAPGAADDNRPDVVPDPLNGPAVTAPAPRGTAAVPGGGTRPGPVGPGVTRTGPGVTASTIAIGINYVDTAEGSSYASGFGLKGLEGGDVKAQARALQSHFNSRGGLAAGRKLELVLHPVDLAQSLSANAQAACADFTQDHKVFAAFTALEENYPNDTLAACLARSGVITVSGAYVPGSSKAFFDRYPYYAPGQFESVSAARTYADGLRTAGYFAPGARVGLVYWDAPSFVDAYREGLVPALRRHGLSVSEAVPIQTAQSTSDVGPVVSSIQGAVLRFQTSGIDHVLFLDSGGALAQYFMTGAQNQQYTPRYGLTSSSNLPLLELNVPASQLRRALAVGWQPPHDVQASRMPVNAAARDCERIMRSAGIMPASQRDRWVMHRLCSGFFFLQAALSRAPDWSLQGFRSGVERLGRPTSSNALGFAERYAPDKHWGTDAYRIVTFRDHCACFAYTSSPHPV